MPDPDRQYRRRAERDHDQEDARNFDARHLGEQRRMVGRDDGRQAGQRQSPGAEQHPVAGMLQSGDMLVRVRCHAGRGLGFFQDVALECAAVAFLRARRYIGVGTVGNVAHPLVLKIPAYLGPQLGRMAIHRHRRPLARHAGLRDIVQLGKQRCEEQQRRPYSRAQQQQWRDPDGWNVKRGREARYRRRREHGERDHGDQLPQHRLGAAIVLLQFRLIAIGQ